MTFEPLKTKPMPRSTSVDCAAGEFGMSAGAMATPVSHMDDLDMVHIRSKKEKRKMRKRNGGGVERERERSLVNKF